MATRPRPDPSEPLVRALSAVPAAELLPRLALERRLWAERLLWDTGDIGRAVDQAARHGLLDGVAVDAGSGGRGHVGWHRAGFLLRLTICLMEGEGLEAVAAAMSTAVLDTFEAPVRGGRARRMEGQLVAFAGQAELDRAFAAHGVRVVPRSYMACALAAWRSAQGPDGAGNGAGDLDVDASGVGGGDELAAEPFAGTSRREAAEVLVAAHEGLLEAEINAGFRDVSAALSYLDEVIGGSGCGHWLPQASSRVRRDGRLVGFSLATRVADGVAHVPQVVVAPEARGEGHGRAALHRTLGKLARAGFETVTLGVSRGNEAALRWYERTGFRELLRFSAYVLER